MRVTSDKKAVPKCLFCGKKSGQVDQLLAGPGADILICNESVE